MKNTGIKATLEDFNKLKSLARKGWMQGDLVIVFSVEEGIQKEQNTMNAKKVCHQLALDYGLPEIEGYYGINIDGEFVIV